MGLREWWKRLVGLFGPVLSWRMNAKKKAQKNMRRYADADATISTSTNVAPLSMVTSTPITVDPLPTHEKGFADPNPMLDNNEPQTETQTEEEKKDETSAAVIEDIEHIMKKSKRIQEAAKGKDMSGGDERRERTGNTTDMLMGLLDQLAFDDDDDEGGGDCDSSDEE